MTKIKSDSNTSSALTGIVNAIIELPAKPFAKDLVKIPVKKARAKKVTVKKTAKKPVKKAVVKKPVAKKAVVKKPVAKKAKPVVVKVKEDWNSKAETKFYKYWNRLIKSPAFDIYTDKQKKQYMVDRKADFHRIKQYLEVK